MTTSAGAASAAAAKSHFNSIGALHLTQEECNEILIKRAIAAGHGHHHQQHHHHTTLTHAGDGAQHHTHHSTAPGTTPSKHLQICVVLSTALSLSPPAISSYTRFLSPSVTLSLSHLCLSLSLVTDPSVSCRHLGYTGLQTFRISLLFLPLNPPIKHTHCVYVTSSLLFSLLVFVLALRSFFHSWFFFVLFKFFFLFLVFVNVSFSLCLKFSVRALFLIFFLCFSSLLFFDIFPDFWIPFGYCSVGGATTFLGDILPGISVQVQKVIQGLEENEDSQGDAPNLKLEPGTLELSPKTELQESMHFSEVSSTIQ